jgi:hypothetical protein
VIPNKEIIEKIEHTKLNLKDKCKISQNKTSLENAILDLLNSKSPPSQTWRIPIHNSKHSKLDLELSKNVENTLSQLKKQLSPQKPSYLFQIDPRLLHLTQYTPITKAYDTLIPLIKLNRKYEPRQHQSTVRPDFCKVLQRLISNNSQ